MKIELKVCIYSVLLSSVWVSIWLITKTSISKSLSNVQIYRKNETRQIPATEEEQITFNCSLWKIYDVNNGGRKVMKYNRTQARWKLSIRHDCDF